MSQSYYITKADGTRELFDERKLLRSLTKAGAQKNAARSILKQIQEDMTDGMSTRAIYRRAFTLLKGVERPLASRYSMKRALFELGPTGYPFEDFVAELLKSEGYTTTTRKLVKGVCATHEVDVIAERGDEKIGVEAKFHNKGGMTSDLKVALYVKARYDDIRKAPVHKNQKPFTGFWLVTNTKFSGQAFGYGSCAGLGMVSWLDPYDGLCLRDRIEKARLHPVSSMTTLQKREKELLMQENIVLCRSLRDHIPALARSGIRGKKLERVLEEADRLCPVRS